MPVAMNPDSLIAELDARHVYDLDHAEQVLLAGVWFGYVAEELSPLLAQSPATTRRHLAKLV